MSSSKPTLDGHEKPRKLEDDSAVYLAQMDVEFDKLPVDDIDGRSILAENVLRDVEHRLASASCDRRTNFIVEKFITDGSIEVLIDCMKRCKDYVVFLARNRFASHIVQSLLARLTYLLKDQPNAETEHPTLVESVVSFCSPLLHDMHWLSQEQCSSHVLRSVVCLLAGVPPVAEKKTKKAKHQHSVTYSLTLDELVVAGTFPIAHRFSITVPLRFKEVLLSYCAQLHEKKSAHDLQLLVANVSSNAFLLLLLRVLGCPERFVDAQGFQLAQSVVLKIMELSDPAEYGFEASVASSTFFAMAGDRCGSFFLEAVAAFLERNLFLGLVHGNCLGTLEAYLQDATSNFVLQAVARRLDHELAQLAAAQAPPAAAGDEDDERSAKKRKKEAKRAARDPFRPYVVRTAVALVEELLQTATAADDVAAKRRMWQERGGVLLTLLQCALTLRRVETDDDRAHQLLAEQVARLVLFTWTTAAFAGDVWTVALDDKGLVADAARHLSQRITAPPPTAAPAAEGDRGGGACAPTAAAPSSSGAKGYVDLSAQLLQCRLLGALLTFPTLKVALLAANVVLALDAAALKLVSTTGNLSRSVFDTYLRVYAPAPAAPAAPTAAAEAEPPVAPVDGELPSLAQQAQMTKQLSATLVGLAAELAGHFVGQHIVRRIFDASDIRGRERWVQVLSAPAVLAALQRTKEGRGSLQLVQAEAYVRDAAEWRNAMKKQMRAAELFKDLLGDAPAAPAEKKKGAKEDGPRGKEDAAAAADDEDGDDDGDEAAADAAGGKRKRKRKRPNQKAKASTA
eukprot:gene8278-5969_t